MPDKHGVLVKPSKIKAPKTFPAAPGYEVLEPENEEGANLKTLMALGFKRTYRPPVGCISYCNPMPYFNDYAGVSIRRHVLSCIVGSMFWVGRKLKWCFACWGAIARAVPSGRDLNYTFPH